MPRVKKPSDKKTVIASPAESGINSAKQSPKQQKIAASPKTPRNGNKQLKGAGLSVPVYSLAGTKAGRLVLPKELFGTKVNKPLLAQAVRVYLNNLKAHFGSTKTRSEVQGSTRKIRVQKGTGGARHGGIRAPIFVGGGIALGPKYRKVVLDLPKKMRKAALISALSARALEGEVLGVAGLEKASGKTKEVQNLINKMDKKDILIVTADKNEKFIRAARNLSGSFVINVGQLNAFNILAHQTLVLTKASVKNLRLSLRPELRPREVKGEK